MKEKQEPLKQDVDIHGSGGQEVAEGLLPVKRQTENSSYLVKLELGLVSLLERFPTIRVNQLQALWDLKEFLRAGKREGYFRMPTGAGKTILFGLIAQILDEATLILVPNNHLLSSTLEELLALGCDPKSIGCVGGGLREQGRQFTLMTYQSYLRAKAPKGTRLIVCDEVHRSLGDQTRARIRETLDDDILDERADVDEELSGAIVEQKGLEKVHRENKGVLILGFTATPTMRGKTVDEIHGELISQTSYGSLTKAGILKSVCVHRVPGNISSDMEEGKMTREKEDKLIERENTYHKLIQAYITFRSENPGLSLKTAVFCGTVEGCRRFLSLAESFNLSGLIVTGEQGDLKTAERALISQEIDFIITVDKLKEGWNFPPLNAVIWARATSSPASLIQGVGRGMRAFQSEKTTHLFETEWRISSDFHSSLESTQQGGSSASRNQREVGERISNKALSFAQALAAIGEDPASVLENPEEASYLLYVTVDENGVGEIVKDDSSRQVVGLAAYAVFRGISITTLQNKVESELHPLKDYMGMHYSRSFLLYDKSEVDRVLDEYRPDGKTIRLVQGVARVEVDDSAVEVVGISAYSSALGKDYGTLMSWIAKAGLTALPDITTRPQATVVYLKSEVDKIIEANTPKEFVVELQDKGVGIWGTGLESREVVGINSYTQARGIPKQTIKKWLAKAGVSPIVGVLGRKANSNVEVYSKSEVDAVISAKRPETQKVNIGESGLATVETEKETFEVIGLNAYSTFHGMNSAVLQGWIEEAGVLPVPGVEGKNVHRTFPVYYWKEVEPLIQMKRRKS